MYRVVDPMYLSGGMYAFALGATIVATTPFERTSSAISSATVDLNLVNLIGTTPLIAYLLRWITFGIALLYLLLGGIMFVDDAADHVPNNDGTDKTDNAD